MSMNAYTVTTFHLWNESIFKISIDNIVYTIDTLKVGREDDHWLIRMEGYNTRQKYSRPTAVACVYDDGRTTYDSLIFPLERLPDPVRVHKAGEAVLSEAVNYVAIKGVTA